MSAIRKVGDWRRARRTLATYPARMKIALERATAQEAQLLRKMIVQGITSQAPHGEEWEELSPMTLAARRLAGFRGSKTLIVRGDLRNSVTVLKRGAQTFVGVPRTARDRDGEKLVQVAELQEFGSDPIVIEITDAMRAYLGALFGEADGAGRGDGSGSGGVVVTQIPPRPFLQPAFKAWRRGLRPRFQARVSALMAGLGG